MDTTLPWALIYQKTVDGFSQNQSYFNNGISLAASFILFILISVHTLVDIEKLRALALNPQDPSRDVSPDSGAKEVGIFWKPILVYTFAILMGLFLENILSTWALLYCSKTTGTYVFMLVFLPCVAGAFLLTPRIAQHEIFHPRVLETFRNSPKEIPRKVPGFFRIKSSFVLFLAFFPFVFIHAALFVLFLSSGSSLWSQPYVLEGTVIKKFRGTRASCHLKLQVEDAKRLTPRGLQGDIQHTGSIEQRLPCKLYKGISVRQRVTVLGFRDDIFAMLGAPPSHNLRKRNVTPTTTKKKKPLPKKMAP